MKFLANLLTFLALLSFGAFSALAEDGKSTAGDEVANPRPFAIVEGLTAYERAVLPYVVQSHHALDRLKGNEGFLALSQPQRDAVLKDWNELIVVRTLEPREANVVALEFRIGSSLDPAGKASVQAFVTDYLHQDWNDARRKQVTDRLTVMEQLKLNYDSQIRDIRGRLLRLDSEAAAISPSRAEQSKAELGKASQDSIMATARLETVKAIADRNAKNVKADEPVPPGIAVIIGQDRLPPRNAAEVASIQSAIARAVAKAEFDQDYAARILKLAQADFDASGAEAASMAARQSERQLLNSELPELQSNLNALRKQQDDLGYALAVAPPDSPKLYPVDLP